jgi:hypothetical protein
VRFPVAPSNPVSSHPNLQYTPIDNEISGSSTPITKDTPSSATISADTFLNNNTDNWLATHFPPTYFMESPSGSGRFVVLISKLQRRPEGMPTVYTSRFDAVSGGLTEVWEAGMLEGQKETEIDRMEIDGHQRDVAVKDNNGAKVGFGRGDAGQVLGLGDLQDSLLNQNLFPDLDHNSYQLHFPPNSQYQEYQQQYQHEQRQGQRQGQGQTSTTHIGSDPSLTWAQLTDLLDGGQLQTPRNQDQGHDQGQGQRPHQGQLPTWNPDPIPEAPQSAENTQQIPQEASSPSQWPTFAQLLSDIDEEGWGKYDPTLTVAPDTTTHPIPDSTIQPSISPSDAATMTGTATTTGPGTGSWIPTNPATSSQPQTQPPPMNQNTAWFDTESLSSIATNAITNTIPHTSSENPDGLDDLFEDTDKDTGNQSLANEQPNGPDAGPALFESTENLLLTNEQLNEMLGGEFF